MMEVTEKMMIAGANAIRMSRSGLYFDKLSKEVYESMQLVAPDPWIKIEGPETLPKHSGRCFVALKSRVTAEHYYHSHLGCFASHITHWREMPDPPKQKQESPK